MKEVIHVIMKMRDQETYFDGEPYAHYEIGWKKGDIFHSWNGVNYKEDDIEEWEMI